MEDKDNNKKGLYKIKYSKFIVFLVIMLNVWFANKTLNIYMVTGSEPTELIRAWFIFTVVELLSLAGIKLKDGTKNSLDIKSFFKKPKKSDDTYEENYEKRV